MEAIEQHGDITIATQSFEKNDLSWIQIDISDSGPGLSPLHIKKVFQPFYSSKAHHKANMGLGLSITKRLVELWGGHISVTNTNEGCRFSVTLPRVPQQN
jgi:signal transduction histidine kinase